MSALSEAGAYVEAVVSALPGRSGAALRRAYYRRRLGRLGADAEIGPNLRVLGPKNVTIGSNFVCWRGCVLAACDDGRIEIGERVGFNSNVYVNACLGGRILLGDDVLVGPNVVLRASDHRFDDLSLPIARQGHTGGEIIVGSDVWIGANVVVTAGVRIGDGAVVAAGGVVTADVEPGVVVGGVPARPIRRRGTRSSDLWPTT